MALGPGRADDLVRDLGPGPAVRPHAKALEPHVGGERHVGLAVADHIAVVRIENAFLQVLLHQTRLGLAALAAVARHVRADEDLVKVRALALENLHHQLVRSREVGPRKALGAESVLVRNHDELPARLAQALQSRKDALDELHLFEAVDLKVLGLLENGAVAVHKENAFAHASSFRMSSSAARRRSFSSFVPIVMRMQFSSVGWRF